MYWEMHLTTFGHIWPIYIQSGAMQEPIGCNGGRQSETQGQWRPAKVQVCHVPSSLGDVDA